MNVAPSQGPLALRMSVTDRCQLRCRYCVPPEGVTLRPRVDILSYEELTRVAGALHRCFGLSKIRVTGGDPLVRADIARLVRMLAVLGVPDLALTTNAQQLAPLAADLKAAGLGRVNISLDALDAAVYRAQSGGGDVARVFDGIAAARRCGLRPIKLNAVVVRGVNDGELPALLAFALEQDCEMRFLELMPIGIAAARHAAQFVSADEMRARLAERFELDALPAEAGSTSRRWRVRERATGRRGAAGFIAPESAPFCGDCRRLRLTADGRLLGCLAQGDGVDLRARLRAGAGDAELADLAGAALRLKQGRRTQRRQEAMHAIGG